MKKISILVLVSLLLLLAFSSCTLLFEDQLPGQENEEEQTQQPVHEHAFGEAWVKEELIHYHMCECGEKGEVAGHADNNGNNLCDVCEYELPTEPATYVVTVKVVYADGTPFFGNTLTVKEGKDLTFDLMVGVDCTLFVDGVTLISEVTENGTRTYTYKLQSVSSDLTVTVTATVCEHSFVDATCTEAMYCKLCTVVKGEPNGHDWIKADCVTAKTCAVCGEVEGEPNGHTPGAPASCYDAQYCEICNELLVDVLGHISVTVPGYPADCINAGLTDGATCETCGVTLVEQETIAPLGHTASDWIVDVAPTCTSTGSQHKECEVCGVRTKTETIPATGHSLSDATCTEAPLCSVCNTTVGTALGHSMSAATCAAPATCSVCGATEGEVADHADTNRDFKCDTCSTVMLPADGEALTVSEALAIAKLHSHNTYTTQKYYVTGMITSVANTTYGNIYIEDEDGNKLYIYGLYDATGNTRYDAMSYKPVAGDEVTVYTVLGMYNDTAQGKNAWLDEVIMHAHNYNEQAFAPTCTADGYTLYTCTICTNSYRVEGEEALGHTTENGTCDRCGSQVGGDVANVLPAALVVSSSVANKASADTYITNNHPGWTITGKLGQTYAGMIGFGRSGDTKSSLKSPAISASSSFTVVAVLNGAGASSGVLTSTLTFTLVDESGALVATGYANGKSAVTPAQGKDETFTFTFTFEEGKTWTDVSNLVVSFVKATGNLGLKSITFVEG